MPFCSIAEGGLEEVRVVSAPLPIMRNRAPTNMTGMPIRIPIRGMKHMITPIITMQMPIALFRAGNGARTNSSTAIKMTRTSSGMPIEVDFTFNHFSLWVQNKNFPLVDRLNNTLAVKHTLQMVRGD